MKRKENLSTGVFEKIKKSPRVCAIHSRSSSELTPSAQDVTPCDLRENLETIISLIETTLRQLELRDSRLHALLDIQYHYGLRISEALAITHYDITPGGKIRILGKKKSCDRIIVPGSSLLFFQRCKERRQDPFSIYDRYFVYREYNKLGIKKYMKDNSKYSVTHLCRYIAIKDLRGADISIEETSKFIGHKNKENTKVYERKV